MIRTLSRLLLTLSLFILFNPGFSHAQDLTGIWRGYFTTEYNSQYKFELQIKQTGNTISGVSYSYLSTVFYGKATLTGSFSALGQSALVREIKTVELRMDGGTSACIMKCLFQYEQSGKEQFLEGTFTSVFEKDDSVSGIRRGADCGGGKVFLRKVTSSDFYIEPFLRKNVKPDVPVIVSQPPTKRDSTNRPGTKPPIKKPIVNSKPIVKTNPVKKPIAKTNTNPTKPTTKPVTKPTTKPNTNTARVITPVQQKTDTTTKIILAPIKNVIVKELTPVPLVLKTRENALVKTLVVTDPNITVKLYDNGEIDGDTISVYFDKKIVLASGGLTASPLVINLKLDDANTDHELVMVAENMGRIPPNTALMIVECGDQRFDVHITSTDQKNAVVRFRYQKPN